MQSEQPQFSPDRLIFIIQTFDWTDCLQSKLGDTPTNPHYQFHPQQEYSKYYRLFRVMLNTEEVSQRCYHLSTLLLELKMSNYYAMMLRKRYFTSLAFNPAGIAQQLSFINHLLSSNSKEYQLWTYKKHIFKLFKQQCSTNLAFYELQISFLQALLEEDSKNYHVWDYRLWLTTYFQKQQDELQSTYHRLFVGPALNKKMKEGVEDSEIKLHTIQWENCYSLWSYRYNLSKLYYSTKSQAQKQEFQARELEMLRKWITQPINLKNQCGWNYYIGIAVNYVSVSVEKLREILAQILELFERQSKNRFIGNACLQMLETFQQRNIPYPVQHRQSLIHKLKSIDSARELYYDYLLKH